MAHKELGEVLLEKAINKLDTEVNVDQKPAMQGRYMTMVIRSK